MTTAIDYFTGAVTDDGAVIGYVRFNGADGTYGRRWEITTPDGRFIERVAKRSDAIPVLVSGVRENGLVWRVEA